MCWAAWAPQTRRCASSWRACATWRRWENWAGGCGGGRQAWRGGPRPHYAPAPCPSQAPPPLPAVPLLHPPSLPPSTPPPHPQPPSIHTTQAVEFVQLQRDDELWGQLIALALADAQLTGAAGARAQARRALAAGVAGCPRDALCSHPPHRSLLPSPPRSPPPGCRRAAGPCGRVHRSAAGGVPDPSTHEGGWVGGLGRRVGGLLMRVSGSASLVFLGSPTHLLRSPDLPLP